MTKLTKKSSLERKRLVKKTSAENMSLHLYASGGTNETCTNHSCGSGSGGGSNPSNPGCGCQAMGGNTVCNP